MAFTFGSYCFNPGTNPGKGYRPIPGNGAINGRRGWVTTEGGYQQGTIQGISGRGFQGKGIDGLPG